MMMQQPYSELTWDAATGDYFIIGAEQARVRCTGESFLKFKPKVTGFNRPNQHTLYRPKMSNMYTPHQDKFHGYSQFPRAPLNEKCITSRQSSRKSNRPQHLKNCFNSPEPIPKRIVEPTIPAISEASFKNVANYLSASISTSINTLNNSKVVRLQHRKISRTLDYESTVKHEDISQSLDEQRITCKYINNKPIKSPQFGLLLKHTIPKESVTKKTVMKAWQGYLEHHDPNLALMRKDIQEQERQVDNVTSSRIVQSEEQNTHHHSNNTKYISLDASLNNDSVEYDYYRRQHHQNAIERTQSISLSNQQTQRIGFYYMQNRRRTVSQLEKSCDRVDISKQSEQLEKEFKQYPELNSNRTYSFKTGRGPKFKLDSKVSTEGELFLKSQRHHLDFNINYNHN